VGVDHSRLKALVAEQLLDLPDVRPIEQQVGGEAVPERMYRCVLDDPRLADGSSHGRLQRFLVNVIAPHLPVCGVNGDLVRRLLNLPWLDTRCSRANNKKSRTHPTKYGRCFGGAKSFSAKNLANPSSTDCRPTSHSDISDFPCYTQISISAENTVDIVTTENHKSSLLTGFRVRSLTFTPECASLVPVHQAGLPANGDFV